MRKAASGKHATVTNFRGHDVVETPGSGSLRCATCGLPEWRCVDIDCSTPAVLPNAPQPKPADFAPVLLDQGDRVVWSGHATVAQGRPDAGKIVDLAFGFLKGPDPTGDGLVKARARLTQTIWDAQEAVRIGAGPAAVPRPVRTNFFPPSGPAPDDHSQAAEAWRADHRASVAA